MNCVPQHALVSKGLDPEEVMAEQVVTLQQQQLVIHMLLLLWPKGLEGTESAMAAAAGGALAPTSQPAAGGASAHMAQPVAAAAGAVGVKQLCQRLLLLLIAVTIG